MKRQNKYMKDIDMRDNTTICYYDNNAEEYFKRTIYADIQNEYDVFLEKLKPGARIIDLGAGSGRDIKYFKSKGYKVDGIDASEKMCILATRYSGVEVELKCIQEWNPRGTYDGIWANASLLHLKEDECLNFLQCIHLYLSVGGIAYISLKKGKGSAYDSEGRYFAKYNRDTILTMLSQCVSIRLLEIWESQDSLSRIDTQWISFIVQKV